MTLWVFALSAAAFGFILLVNTGRSFNLNLAKAYFLGFLPNTMKNIIWFDMESCHIKLLKHACFDEGMNDLPFDAILPNVQHLMWSKEGNAIPPKPCKSSIDHFEFSANPFAHTLSKTLKVTDCDLSFGMEIAQDELSNRAYVHEIKDKSSASQLFSSLKAMQNKI